MKRETLRTWAVRFTYASIAGHLLVGALLPLIINAPLFDAYHRSIEAAFWGADVPAAAPPCAGRPLAAEEELQLLLAHLNRGGVRRAQRRCR